MVYKWIDFARNALFPAACRLCLAATNDGLSLCPACRAELPWLQHTCSGCAVPLAPDGPPGRCPACLETPPGIDNCQALFAYQAPVDSWIHALKFRRDLAAARLLGRLLAAQHPVPDPDVTLVPVPLHRRRLRERGYNQVEEILRPVTASGWHKDATLCRRLRPTDAQSGLSAARRRHNLDKAFGVRGPLNNRRIVLVDDVMTTGSTLNELAGTLKAAGAERVDAWVIARALKPG